jgi:hypothetical protein
VYSARRSSLTQAENWAESHDGEAPDKTDENQQGRAAAEQKSDR